MNITCIEVVRWKRGLSVRDIKLLGDAASPLVCNVSYRWHLLFKGPAGQDKLATRYWIYQRSDGSRAWGRGASWIKRRKRDWSDLTKGLFIKHRLVDEFETYCTDKDIDDKHVRTAIRRSPSDVLIRTEERWWGEADMSLEDARNCKFAFPYDLGFEGQVRPEEYMIYYRRATQT